MGKTDVQRMREHMETLTEKSASGSTVPMAKRIEALEDLQLLCEDIDNALDFVKAGWGKTLLDLYRDQGMRVETEEDREWVVQVLWLMATLLQNHPKNQNQVVQ